MLSEHYRADQVFHQWLVLAGLVVFGVAVLWDRGLYQAVVRADASHLCLVMTLLFIGTIVHSGLLSRRLARRANALASFVAPLRGHQERVPLDRLTLCGGADTLLADFLHAMAARDARRDTTDAAPLTEVLAERVRGGHAIGWHLTELLVKLGLLGTVIGFMIMLSSVAALESFDIENAQELLSTMMQGMGVALNTTLFGFVCGMLAGLQYLMLDHAADSLIADAVYLAEARLQSTVSGEGDHGL